MICLKIDWPVRTWVFSLVVIDGSNIGNARSSFGGKRNKFAVYASSQARER